MNFESLKQSSSNFDKLTKAIEANLNPEDKEKNKSKFQSTNLTELTNPVFRTALREESYENTSEESQALEYLRNRYFLFTFLFAFEFS